MPLLSALFADINTTSEGSFHSCTDLVHDGVSLMANQEVDVGTICRDRRVISPELHRRVHFDLAAKDSRDVVSVECVIAPLLAGHRYNLSQV